MVSHPVHSMRKILSILFHTSTSSKHVAQAPHNNRPAQIMKYVRKLLSNYFIFSLRLVSHTSFCRTFSALVSFECNINENGKRPRATHNRQAISLYRERYIVGRGCVCIVSSSVWTSNATKRCPRSLPHSLPPPLSHTLSPSLFLSKNTRIRFFTADD